MRLDIRLPLGLLFSVIGVLLAGFGMASDKTLYARSLHININLWWGTAILVFGLAMLVLGRRSHRRLADVGGASTAEAVGKSASEHK
jgi:hypothetical protein